MASDDHSTKTKRRPTMKIRSTLFGALLLCAALAVPAAANQDDKTKDKKQEQQQGQSEDRASKRGKPTEAEQRTDQDDREPDPARDDNDRDTPGGDAMRMKGLDTDGDGRITRAEWRGNDTSFNQHDTD